MRGLPARILACACLVHLAGSTPVVAAPSSTPAHTWDEKRIALPLVGSGMAYVPRTPTPHVVLLVSGDAGWNAAIIAIARRIAAAQALVIGVSYPALKRRAAREQGCWYVASDLELISHAAQKKLRLPQHNPPVLVGYLSGATLVYAALAGAPTVTFAGAISLGFCPGLAIGRDVCSGNAWDPEYDPAQHTNVLPPTRNLPKDWHVLQGADDNVCSVADLRRFVSGMPKAHLTEVAGTGHSFLSQARWGVVFDKALQDLWAEKEVRPPSAKARSATTRELEGELQRLQLPLEYRWPVQPSALVVFFSGDGGWASLDEDMSEGLVARGIGVIGVSSLRYFWNAKQPAQVAADLRRLVATIARSGKPVFVGGFSFGAEIVPVVLGEWTPAERHDISGVVLIGPGPSASFEIDPLDWIRKPEDNPSTRVAPALGALARPALCLAGAEEEDTPCASPGQSTFVRVVRLPGSHHFNGDYDGVAEAVARFIRAASTERRP